ncbi:MAG: ribonuclease P protein component [Aliishimia sp.]
MTTPNTDLAAAENDSAAALVRPKLTALTNRSDFLKAARGPRKAMPGFIVQIRNRNDDDPRVRVGFTCSKKVGNAVARNRAKRRLREIAHLTLPQHAAAGHDYVLIGRAKLTANLPLDQLRSDLAMALRQ